MPKRRGSGTDAKKPMSASSSAAGWGRLLGGRVGVESYMVYAKARKCHYTALRTLVPGPRAPEVPREGVQFLPDGNRLVAREALLKRPFVLRRGPHVQALAEIGVGIDVVEPVVALLGDERSPRCQSTQIGELLRGIGELHLEAGSRQELLRPHRAPRIVHEPEGLHLHPVGRARVRNLEVEEGPARRRNGLTHRLDHAPDRATRRIELADPKLDIRRIVLGLVVDVADDPSLALAAGARGPFHAKEAIGEAGGPPAPPPTCGRRRALGGA